MDPIKSKMDPASAEFKANKENYEKMVKDLKEKQAFARNGGSDELKLKHKERNKLLARDRIDKLLDPDSPFLEICTLAAHDMYNNDAPCAGIVCGIGLMHGREVMVRRPSCQPAFPLTPLSGTALGQTQYD